MKLVRYVLAGESEARSGVLTEDGVHRIASDLLPAELLARGMDGFEVDDAPLRAVRLVSPVGLPPSIRDFMSFETHVNASYAALGRTVDPVWYQQPVFFFSNPAAAIGPESDVPISPGSAAFDYEMEIGAVIGTSGQDIPAAEAENHIAGYTIFCDWSARDIQERETRVGLGPAKGKDTASTFGPFLVTPDELESLRTDRGFDVEFTASVNDRLYSRGNWSSIYWTFPQMIAYASRGAMLRTGDVIGSGTIGTGCILELGGVHGFDAYPYLRPGDVVRIDAGPLGSFAQTVAAYRDPEPL